MTRQPGDPDLKSREQAVQYELPMFGPPAPLPEATYPFGTSLLALSHVQGLGIRGLRSLVREHGDSLGLIWDLDHDRLHAELTRLKVSAAKRVSDDLIRLRDELIAHGQEEAASIAERGVKLLGPRDLPDRFSSQKDGPLWLFVEGDVSALSDGPHVAVVGTRKASASGIKAAEAAARTMAAYPITLVSGLADGIDAAAHAASLRDGVRNVAFLGHGIDIVFPAETAGIRQLIVKNGGAVASEYMMGEHYRKSNFVERDRLQAGLADLVICVEGEQKSGTAHTIRFASNYRRPIIGLRWPDAGDLIKTIEAEPTGLLIDVFTPEGRRQLDATLRRLATEHGHDAFGLSLVERQLRREAELRQLSPDDLLRLRRQIDELLGKR
jgi:DNA processing protein